MFLFFCLLLFIFFTFYHWKSRPRSRPRLPAPAYAERDTSQFVSRRAGDLLADHHATDIAVVAGPDFVGIYAARDGFPEVVPAVPVSSGITRSVHPWVEIAEVEPLDDAAADVVDADSDVPSLGQIEGNPRLWVERVRVVGKQSRHRGP